jgi:hypothetical protein
MEFVSGIGVSPREGQGNRNSLLDRTTRSNFAIALAALGFLAVKYAVTKLWGTYQEKMWLKSRRRSWQQRGNS